MNGFLIRSAISAVGLAVAAALIPGIHVDGSATLLLAGLLLGVVNAVVRPVIVLLTLPITVLTLGLFLWVVNALMLALVAWLLDGFTVTGLLPAMLGSVLVGATGWLANATFGRSHRVEWMVEARRG